MIASPLSSLALAFVLAASLPAPDASGTKTTPISEVDDASTDATPVVVVVTSNLGIDDGGAVENTVRDATVRGLQAHGLAPAEQATTRLTVQIEWVDDARDGYALRYTVEASGRPGTERTSQCPRCGSDELVELIEQDLGALAPELAAEPVALPQPTVAEPPAPQPAARRFKLGRMGVAGVSVLVSGVAVAVPGVVLALLGDARRPDPDNSQFVEVRHRRTPGLIVVGVGAAAIVVGAVLLGVDQRRRSPKSTRTSRVAITGLGLGVRW